MVEIFSQLVSKIIDIGWDKHKEDKIFNRLKDAVIEKMYRELKFNDEILKETESYKKTDNTLIDVLIETLSTDSFDELVKSSVPLSLIFENHELSKENWEDFCKSSKLSNKNMLKWAENIKNQADLIERIYHRIKILKTLRNVSIRKGHQSIRYVRFLISAYQSFKETN